MGRMGGGTSKSGLSQADLEYLLRHTAYDKATVYAWYGVFNRNCTKGRLSVKQFLHLFKTFFPSRNSDQFCEHVFRTFNTSKSGELSFKEVLEVLETSIDLRDEDTNYYRTQKTAEELFLNLDSDGVGGLTEEQFVRNCLQFGVE